MKRIALLALAAAAVAPSWAATNVGVSIGINQPGAYGRIDIGNFPQPAVVYPQPVVIAPTITWQRADGEVVVVYAGQCDGAHESDIDAWAAARVAAQEMIDTFPTTDSGMPPTTVKTPAQRKVGHRLI